MPLERSELEPLLRLALVQGIGPLRMTQLLERFGRADRVLAASVERLCRAPGIGPELARRIHQANERASVAATRVAMRRLEELGASVLTPADPLYPDPFRDVAEPPYLLFVVGDPSLLLEPSIAVVGTRTPTVYGRDSARVLSRDLALAGFVIVSGMARGVDTAAHLGALDAGGPTVGVLGHGIEQTYPPENAKLFARVREHGLLVTEFPPGETPKAGNFPRRNRLITALAEAVLVVEMGRHSGAQHTVGFALEQGKEVMAVPGPIGSPVSAGTNQLIKEGARMVTAAEDVIEELRGVGSVAAFPGGKRTGRGAAPVQDHPALALLSEPEARVLAALSPLPTHVDVVQREAGLSAPQALAALLDLELRGLVRAMPGKTFSRTNPSG